MSNFTKGKWGYDEPLGVIFSNETYVVIANVQGAGTGSCFCFTQEGQANARLIAAAPDMYEFLKVCAKTEEPGNYVPAFLDLKDKARELLERIDGNSVDKKANARLIAAAPEMYDLLYEALQELKGYDPIGNGISTIYPDIEELLARIDGDSQED